MEKIKIGDLVTYNLAIVYIDRVYRYIQDLPHGIALCEDNEGNRWRFSRGNLLSATEKQKKTFKEIKE